MQKEKRGKEKGSLWFICEGVEDLYLGQLIMFEGDCALEISIYQWGKCFGAFSLVKPRQTATRQTATM